MVAAVAAAIAGEASAPGLILPAGGATTPTTTALPVSPPRAPTVTAPTVTTPKVTTPTVTTPTVTTPTVTTPRVTVPKAPSAPTAPSLPSAPSAPRLPSAPSAPRLPSVQAPSAPRLSVPSAPSVRTPSTSLPSSPTLNTGTPALSAPVGGGTTRVLSGQTPSGSAPRLTTPGLTTGSLALSGPSGGGTQRTLSGLVGPGAGSGGPGATAGLPGLTPTGGGGQVMLAGTAGVPGLRLYDVGALAIAQFRRGGNSEALRQAVNALQGCIYGLSGAERQVLILRGGLVEAPLSRRQAARRLGISPRRVARLEQRGLIHLQSFARSRGCADGFVGGPAVTGANMLTTPVGLVSAAALMRFGEAAFQQAAAGKNPFAVQGPSVPVGSGSSPRGRVDESGEAATWAIQLLAIMLAVALVGFVSRIRDRIAGRATRSAAVEAGVAGPNGRHAPATAGLNGGREAATALGGNGVAAHAARRNGSRDPDRAPAGNGSGRFERTAAPNGSGGPEHTAAKNGSGNGDHAATNGTHESEQRKRRRQRLRVPA